MNTYQRIAFGAFGLLLLALALVAIYDLNGLKVAAAFALVVALLTLKTTWKLLFICIQVVGTIIGGAGHVVGTVGDELVDWSKDRRVRLSSARTSNVPSWDSPSLNRIDDQPTDTSDELAVPSFMDTALDRQNV